MAGDYKSMMFSDDTDQFLLPVGRVVWADLFVPGVYTDPKTGVQAAPKYSVSLIWSTEELVAVQAVIDGAIGRLMKQPGFPPYACLRDGNKEKQLIASGVRSDQIEVFTRSFKYEQQQDLEKHPYFVGMVQLKMNAAEKFPPVIVGPGGPSDRITSERKAEIYRGCYGIPMITLGYSKANKQLFYRLKGFQKVKEGEALGSSSGNINLFESFNTEAHSAVSEEI